MESQGEREPGVLEMDVGLLESMAQDGVPEQEMLNEQEQFPPQTDPEPEMGAQGSRRMTHPPSPPRLLRQNPSPAPSETATDNGGSVLLGPSDIAQLMLMMQANTQQMSEMNEKMDGNTQQMSEMNNKMDGNMQTLRGEMQRVGQCLQGCFMAAPSGSTTEPTRGSVDCVGPAVEDKLIRGTCRTRHVEVTTTETLTVTEREKLNGVTETCTRHVETREITREETEVTSEVTELAETRRETQELEVLTEITETREIEGELDEVEDAHTHGVSEGP